MPPEAKQNCYSSKIILLRFQASSLDREVNSFHHDVKSEHPAFVFSE